ncbi:tetratricopeptide repeat protein [Streptomyces sp. NPDC058961]|uniref:tetratricopeptide repeat protein n=1 Tax=Streptomyces sp. NPDC058961 TaxID=3346680 RepID=UPI00367B6230
MQAENQEVMSACAEAEEHLRAGRLAEARRAAGNALTAEGPDARLFLTLGRAHAAENEDDHDDRAEAAYQEGLEAFPDDLDLLAAYAELCLASDYLDRPARSDRGPELARRVRELAPGSPQALRVERSGRGLGGPKPPSASRTQLHDVRLVLAAVGDPASAAARARRQAEARPGDDRLAVLAETLGALARPGRAPLRRMARAPVLTGLLRAAWYVVVLLAVPALHLPWWSRLAVLAPLLVALPLNTLLRRARTRAAARPPAPPVDAGAPAFPALPPVPAYRRRELATGAVVLVAIVAAGVASGVWSYRQYAAYPHYTVSAPDRLQGLERQDASPVRTRVESLIPDLSAEGARTFDYVYGPDPEQPALLVWGATGDFHDAPAEGLADIQRGAEAIGYPVRSSWSAAPGSLGGSMRCVSYEVASTPMVNCAWLDKGSMGAVYFTDEGQGQEASAKLARSAREAILHRGTGNDSEV